MSREEILQDKISLPQAVDIAKDLIDSSQEEEKKRIDAYKLSMVDAFNNMSKNDDEDHSIFFQLSVFAAAGRDCIMNIFMSEGIGLSGDKRINFTHNMMYVFLGLVYVFLEQAVKSGAMPTHNGRIH